MDDAAHDDAVEPAGGWPIFVTARHPDSDPGLSRESDARCCFHPPGLRDRRAA